MISFAISIIFKIIYLIIILTCLLSWIPVLNPTKEPMASILTAYNKLMSPFRGLIPPIAGRIDITPLVVFILLQVIENILYRILAPLGL
jgi:uncharacterized protein YggT (Ycf19 family)